MTTRDAPAWTADERERPQRRERTATCASCGAQTKALGRRGPVPTTCATCKRQRSAVRYVRAAARIAEDLELAATARELRQLAAHLEHH